MSERTREIDNETIWAASIRDTGVATSDHDADGYRTTNGTDRRIMSAVTDDGLAILYMVSNGPETAIPEERDLLIRVAYDLGDAPDDCLTRVRCGIARIKEAASLILQADKDNEALAGDMYWYLDVANALKAVVAREDCAELDDLRAEVEALA